MSKRSTRLLVEDMLEATERIVQYTHGMSQTTFLQDQKTGDAVARNLEIIGEAANRLPGEFTQQYPSTDWPKIIGLRHRIVHDYFGIDLLIVWQIVQTDLPLLRTKLEAVRAELGT